MLKIQVMVSKQGHWELGNVREIFKLSLQGGCVLGGALVKP